MLVQLYLELGYFAAVNLVAFILMGIDKQRAKKHLWRIPEKALFLAVILGGGIGGTAGMFFFRHKTRHWYFHAVGILGLLGLLANLAQQAGVIRF